MENIVKRQRKPRTNYAAEHQKLTMYLKISIGLLNGINANLGDNAVALEFNRGQLAALKAVQQQIGAAE